MSMTRMGGSLAVTLTMALAIGGSVPAEQSGPRDETWFCFHDEHPEWGWAHRDTSDVDPLFYNASAPDGQHLNWGLKSCSKSHESGGGPL